MPFVSLVAALTVSSTLLPAPPRALAAPAAKAAHATPAARPVARREAPASILAWQGDAFVADSSLAARLRAAPSTIATQFVLGGESVPVILHRMEVVAPSVDVRLGERSAPELATAIRNVVQWRGEVVGEPGSLVHLAVSDRGAAGIVDRGAGRGRFTLRPIGAAQHGLAQGPVRFDRSSGPVAPDVPICATTEDAGGVAGAGAVPPGVVPVIELAVDTDYEYYAIFNDPQAAAEYVAALYGAISAIYRRDVDATISVSYLRLVDNPNDLFNDSDPLYQFRDWWNANQQGVHRDLATLLTGRRNLPYGGVAWLDATCSDYGYSVTGYINGHFADPVETNPGNWDIVVVAHELGHNVASLHTHSYGIDSCDVGEVLRGSIMSYCHTNSGASSNIDSFFHRICGDEMEGFMVSMADCLASDCDGDGVSDAQAIASGLAADTNADGIPDACQDCDGDGIPDPVAIANGWATDLDGDLRPDSCEPDCNTNGVPDSLDIANGTSLDAWGNGIPDECEADCNGNGVSDYSEIQADMALDRSRDGRLDACEDCDGDGITDFAELLGSTSIWVGRSNSSEIRELHPRSGVVMNTIALGADVTYDLAIGPDGYLYAAGGRFIKRVDRVQRALVGNVFALGAGVSFRGIAFGTDGTLLAATSQGQVLRIDVASGQSLGALFAGSISDPRDVAVRADGRVLVSCGDGRVRQYQTNGSGGVLIDGSASPHDFAGVMEMPDAGSILVVSRAQQAILRYDGTSGAFLGRFDVQASGFLNGGWGLAPSADGHAVLATGSNASSTINGYAFATGYTERTYRVYPADAPSATAICVAPRSSTDMNGNLIPDACEPNPADLNHDGVVDAADLAILLGAWGTPGADLNGDGTTDAADLAILLGSWG